MFVVLLLAYLVILPATKPDPVGTLSGNEQAAMVAAGTEAANLGSYARATFARDYARALAGTTGPLRSQVEGNKSKTLQTLTTYRYDISATVRHTALVGPATARSTSSYVVLVAMYSYSSNDKTVPLPQNLQVTVQKVKGKWLANDVESEASE